MEFIKVMKRRVIKRVDHVIEVQTWPVCMCGLKVGSKSTHTFQDHNFL